MAFEVFHFEVRTRMRKAPDDFLMDSIRETFNLRLSVWDSSFTVLKLKDLEDSSGGSLSATPKSRSLFRISSRLKRSFLNEKCFSDLLKQALWKNPTKSNGFIKNTIEVIASKELQEGLMETPERDYWKMKNLKQFHWNFQIESLSVKEAVSIAYKDL